MANFKSIESRNSFYPDDWPTAVMAENNNNSKGVYVNFKFADNSFELVQDASSNDKATITINPTIEIGQYCKLGASVEIEYMEVSINGEQIFNEQNMGIITQSSAQISPYYAYDSFDEQVNKSITIKLLEDDLHRLQTTGYYDLLVSIKSHYISEAYGQQIKTDINVDGAIRFNFNTTQIYFYQSYPFYDPAGFYPGNRISDTEITQEKYKIKDFDYYFPRKQPTTDGKTFLGWGTSATRLEGNPYSGTKTQFCPIWGHILTVNLNGGSMCNGDIESVETFGVKFQENTWTYVGSLTSENTIKKNPPERTGYSFTSFNFPSSQQNAEIIKSDGSQNFYTQGKGEENGYSQAEGYYIFNGQATENITATAQWTANPYTVTFNANDGSGSTTSKLVTYDSTYGDLPTLTRDGYTFDGWYTAISGGSKITSSTKVSIAKNHILYAHWTAVTRTVTFNANGGSVSPELQSVTYDSEYGDLPIPTRDGYTFNGWYTAANGGSKITSSTTVSTARDHTLYAHWTANNYTITFYANDGQSSTPFETLEVTYNTSNYSSWNGLNISRSGYQLMGYYDASSGGEQIYYIGEDANNIPAGLAQPGGSYWDSNNKWKYDGDVTAYAQWEIIDYSITYDLQGGTIDGANPTTYTIEDTITLINPKRNGYSFTGWTGSNGTAPNKTVTITNTTGNKNYIANWNPIEQYTITYNFNNTEEEQVITKDEFETYTILQILPETERIVTLIDNFNDTETNIGISDIATKWNSTDTQTDYQAGDSFNPSEYLNEDEISIQLNLQEFERGFITLPFEKKDGFMIKGWYSQEDGKGIKAGKGGAIYYPSSDITLYAYWIKSGMVRIKTADGWKKATPYIYKKEGNKEGKWVKAIPYIYDASSGKWRQGL